MLRRWVLFWQSMVWLLLSLGRKLQLLLLRHRKWRFVSDIHTVNPGLRMAGLAFMSEKSPTSTTPSSATHNNERTISKP